MKNTPTMFQLVFCVGGQDVVEWKKKTLPILKFQQWQKVNECHLDDPIYLPSGPSNIRFVCVKSPARKGGMLS